MMKKYYPILFTFFLAAVLISCNNNPSNPFENEIQAFEKMDLDNPPGTGMILFVGSSSLRMWKDIDKVFPDFNVLNRGFGGSQTSDVIHFFDRVVKVYKPSKIVFYEGDNDIATGKSPAQVVADFKTFLELMDKDLAGTPICFIAIKPSPSRWELHNEMEEANKLIREICNQRPDLEFVDVYSLMLDQNGRPKPEIYISDSLHMNAEGYEIWKHALISCLED